MGREALRETHKPTQAQQTAQEPVQPRSVNGGEREVPAPDDHHNGRVEPLDPEVRQAVGEGQAHEHEDRGFQCQSGQTISGRVLSCGAEQFVEEVRYWDYETCADE